MSFWHDKRVVVTGGGGFLGSRVVQKLKLCNCKALFAPGKRDFDLREKEAIVSLFKEAQPNLLIHLAAVVGGIGANRRHPGQFFYENAIMGIQLMEQSRLFNVDKFVCIGTICAYPKFTPVPFKEEDLWVGYPEETNAPYGLAKKMLLVQSQAYRQEYEFNSIYLLPVNLYGPGDNFDRQTSHVIPALIRKFFEARQKKSSKVTAWGTGSVSREFLYVDDAAEAIVLAAEHYNKPEPVNVGSGQEITIRDLVSLIRDLIGFNGQIEWDSSQPNGQPRRCLDTTRADREFGFKAKTALRDGLEKTIEYFETNCETMSTTSSIS